MESVTKKISVAASIVTLALLLVAIAVPAVRAPTEDAQMSAVVKVVGVEFEADNYIVWSELAPGQVRVLADPDNGNPFEVTIKVGTTVYTNTYFKASGDMVSGSDSIPIANVEVDNTPAFVDGFSLSTAYTLVPWMANVAPPTTSTGLNGSELLTNPGFETGTIAPWTKYGADNLSVQSDIKHSGSYAACLTDSSGYGRADQIVGGIVGNDNYSASVWVYRVVPPPPPENAPAPPSVQLKLYWYESTDGSGSAIRTDILGTMTENNAWEQLSGTVIAPATALSCKFSAYVSVSTYTAVVYIDDASLTTGGVSPPPGDKVFNSYFYITVPEGTPAGTYAAVLTVKCEEA